MHDHIVGSIHTNAKIWKYTSSCNGKTDFLTDAPWYYVDVCAQVIDEGKLEATFNEVADEDDDEIPLKFRPMYLKTLENLFRQWTMHEIYLKEIPGEDEGSCKRAMLLDGMACKLCSQLYFYSKICRGNSKHQKIWRYSFQRKN